MCLGAIYWARRRQMFFACTREDAADVGFDDDFIYEEIERPIERSNRKRQFSARRRLDGL